MKKRYHERLCFDRDMVLINLFFGVALCLLLSGGLVERPHDAVMRRVNPANIKLSCSAQTNQLELVVRCF